MHLCHIGAVVCKMCKSRNCCLLSLRWVECVILVSNHHCWLTVVILRPKDVAYCSSAWVSRYCYWSTVSWSQICMCAARGQCCNIPISCVKMCKYDVLCCVAYSFNKLKTSVSCSWSFIHSFGNIKQSIATGMTSSTALGFHACSVTDACWVMEFKSDSVIKSP